ncbi:DUF6232 family protein [Streptomyces olivoreticuli]|uniref:DUF6232 family protein n=1 Tax=Streptomyces olivoreticuli TaxID=68246 RepID=UPI000E2245A9|nr:DUF6232 family protein [Streptomyces olivoreticuli]
MAKRKVINVSIRDRILWVGSAAYPVQNIARAMTVTYAPRRAAAVGRFLVSMLVLALVMVAATAAIDNTPWPLADKETARRALRLLALGLIAIFTIQLLRVLLAKTRHAVFIETSGSPLAVLASTKEQKMREIVGEVAKAINNPLALYHTTVNNHLGDKVFGDKVSGDKFNVFGKHNVGKRREN